MAKSSSLTGIGGQRSRSPNGIGSSNRVNIALYADERREVERLASLDNRSASSMARIFMLRGMAADPNFKPENLEPVDKGQSK